MPCSGRKHTPIVSRKQQKLFGYWQSNPSKRPKSITAGEVESHLSESRGKFSKKKKKKGHHDIEFDYRRVK